MNGKRKQWDSDELRKFLEKDFRIRIDTWGKEDIDRAKSALEVYESEEDFLERSGWGKDNPEAESERYLTENYICRWREGKFFYFSRIVWEA